VYHEKMIIERWSFFCGLYLVRPERRSAKRDILPGSKPSLYVLDAEIVECRAGRAKAAVVNAGESAGREWRCDIDSMAYDDAVGNGDH